MSLDPSVERHLAEHGIPAAQVTVQSFDIKVEQRLMGRLGRAGVNVRGTSLTHDYFFACFANEDAARAAAAVLRRDLSDVQVWLDARFGSQSPWRTGGFIKTGAR